MDIKKVHCFFEQSGTFKNEFIKLGIPAEDYDIQNNFDETNHVIDLFHEIEKAYQEEVSCFDNISKDDLIMAFFPCIHFCDAKGLMFRGQHITQKNKTLADIMKKNIGFEKERTYFFTLLMQLVEIVDRRGLKMIVENPYNQNSTTFLECNFITPQIIDKNRMLRGDYFVKPTAYWFFGLQATCGTSFQKDKKQKIITKCKSSKKIGQCSEERSMISPDYARNFICDFILGKPQENLTQLSLF